MKDCCPYCGGPVTPPKVKKGETSPYAHGHCKSCGKKPKASIHWNNDDKMSVSYSRDGRKKMDDKYRKSIMLQKRISPQEDADLLAGKARLTYTGGGDILIVYTETV